IFRDWDDEGPVEIIISSLRQYELFLENEQHLEKAKKLNKRLYKLDCELMESTKFLDQKHAELDRQIMALEEQIAQRPDKTSLDTEQMINLIEADIQGDDDIETEQLDILFSQAVHKLYEQFNDTAKRNGFEMLKPESGPIQ
ncbi:MAG: hypothetical protein GY729_00590, partial [Desulfobacteraceae bacterium]|nr:hypothetical protein [Desulfobacteraceae bacterium]